MRALRRIISASIVVGLVLGAPVGAQQAKERRKTPGRFKLIGHDALGNRGMNAAPAVHGNYVYIGSRTDGTHPNAGIKVVDVSNPSKPKVVHEIGPPHAGVRGETSRELRVWPQKDLLIVMNLASNCSYLIHACSPESATKPDVIRFFDISGKRAAKPKFVAAYKPSQDPHEMYLWTDPQNRKRALLYMSTPGASKQLLVTDISKARQGKFKELASWTTLIPNPDTDNRLHSLSVSVNGRRGYVAYLGGGFLIIDTSDLAEGKRKPKVKLVTTMSKRPWWGDPGAHSAVKLFGRDWVLTTDEVYGRVPVLLEAHGCPWGWTRMIDISNPRAPKVKADYRLRQNHEKFCDDPTKNSPDRETLSSWSAHNPTLTKHVAFITWHSGGLQAVSLKNPRRPTQLAQFRPKPLPFVLQEDPMLSSGRDKVVMWSYPIIKDGLIYVTDVRNGLYILKYKGPYAGEVANVDFIEGNSNLGDALRFERS